MSVWLPGQDAVPEGVPHLTRGNWYAGYIDGLFVSYHLILARFPGAVVLPITVWGGFEPILPALILDVENGNPTPPARVPMWLIAQQMHGYKLSELKVYANRSTWPAINAALDAAKFYLPWYGRWLAEYTYVPHLPAGYGACQYSDRGGPDLGGGNHAYDLSVAAPQFLHLPTPTIPTGIEDIVSITCGVNKAGQFHVFVERADGRVDYTWQQPDATAWEHDPAGKHEGDLKLFSPAPK